MLGRRSIERRRSCRTLVKQAARLLEAVLSSFSSDGQHELLAVQRCRCRSAPQRLNITDIAGVFNTRTVVLEPTSGSNPWTGASLKRITSSCPSISRPNRSVSKLAAEPTTAQLLKLASAPPSTEGRNMRGSRRKRHVLLVDSKEMVETGRDPTWLRYNRGGDGDRFDGTQQPEEYDCFGGTQEGGD